MGNIDGTLLSISNKERRVFTPTSGGSGTVMALLQLFVG